MIDFIFRGNLGDDTLDEAGGNDTYIYRRGDGNDFILDYGTDFVSDYRNILDLENISLDEIEFETIPDSVDLIIRLLGSAFIIVQG